MGRRASAAAARAALLAVMVCGCFPTGPSRARVACLQPCAEDKDRCILAAATPDDIRKCDDASRSCDEGCPPR